MLTPAPDETLDALANGWRVFQLRRGHRYNTDDLLVAWTAARARPEALSLLDLGSGIGSIGLMTLAMLPQAARLVCVEVQQTSVALARRSVALNQLESRVEIVHGDLRSAGPARTDRFDLITGNPPYLPPGTATLSPVPQRATARVELHGDVFDWCRVAAARLAPGGRFCFCHAASDPRPLVAIQQAGLVLRSRQLVLFRAGRPPSLAVYTAAHEGERADAEDLVIRESSGDWSSEYRNIRRFLRVEE